MSAVVGVRLIHGIEIGQAAQCERKRALRARERRRFGLARAELERGGLADHHALAVLLFRRLVDRQDAHRLRDACGRRRVLTAGELRGNAAGDDEHDDTRRFHTLTPYNHAATGTWPQLPHDAPTGAWPCMLDFST
jgi:hypothetical protein